MISTAVRRSARSSVTSSIARRSLFLAFFRYVERGAPRSVRISRACLGRSPSRSSRSRASPARRVLLRFGIAHRLRARCLPTGPAGGGAAVFARADGDRAPRARRAAETQRRRRALRPLAIAISAWTSLGVYATDRLATSWAARTFGSIAAELARPFEPRPRPPPRSPLREHLLRDAPRVLEPRPARRRPPRHAAAGPLPGSRRAASPVTARSTSTDSTAKAQTLVVNIVRHGDRPRRQDRRAPTRRPRRLPDSHRRTRPLAHVRPRPRPLDGPRLAVPRLADCGAAAATS